MAVDALFMVVPVLLPKVVTAVTMTTKIRLMMMPYSIAVVPRSSRQKRLR